MRPKGANSGYYSPFPGTRVVAGQSGASGGGAGLRDAGTFPDQCLQEPFELLHQPVEVLLGVAAHLLWVIGVGAGGKPLPTGAYSGADHASGAMPKSHACGSVDVLLGRRKCTKLRRWCD